MADISINKFRTAITRGGATPATPGFAETEGQDPVNPSGTGTQYGVGAGLSLDSVNRIQLGKPATEFSDVIKLDLKDYTSINRFILSTDYEAWFNGDTVNYTNLDFGQISTDLSRQGSDGSTSNISIWNDGSTFNFLKLTVFNSLNNYIGIELSEKDTNKLLVVDQIDSKGLINAGDYESNFTARSLVTKQYVDVAVSGATISIGSPANGLSLAGTVLSLGLASSGVTGALSGTDWNTFNGKIGGTIASGQVAFGTGVNTVGGDSGLTWDNVAKRLTINGNVLSTTGFSNVLLNRDPSIVGPINTFTLTNGGSGYVDGTYTNVFISPALDASRNAYFNATVSGGVVTSLILVTRGNRYVQGNTYTINNTLLGGSGSGLIITVNTVFGSDYLSSSSSGSNIRIENNNFVVAAGGLIGSLLFSSRDDSARASGDLVAIRAFQTATNGGGYLDIETAVAQSLDRTTSVRITPTSTLILNGSFGVGNITPTNTLDVNGTTRIRTISNLGSTATRFLVASATGVISERTGAELAADIGATNFWTLVGSDIYRDSAVAIGRTTIPSNATFAVQSRTATGTHQFFQLLNNAGTVISALTQSSEFAVNNAPVTGVTALFKAQTNNASSSSLRAISLAGTTLFEVTGATARSSVPTGIYRLEVDVALGVQPIPGQTQAIRVYNNAGTRTLDILGSTGAYQSLGGAFFGSSNTGLAPTARVDIRGVGTTTGLTLLLEDSAGTNNAEFVDNGRIRFLRLPTSSAGLGANDLWNDGGNVVIGTNQTFRDESTAKTTASADQTLPSGTLTILDYDTTVINNNTSIYTVGTTGRITVNSTGIYTITAGVVVEADAITALESAFLGIFRNGDLVAISSINTTIAAGAQSGLSTSTILSLTSGDIIDCRALVNSVGGVANGLARRLGTLLGANATQVNSLSISKSSQ
jgi:hypothetical protein